MILKLINLVLQFLIIPHLVFTLIRQCRQRVQEKLNCHIPHEIMNQLYDCWGTSGIGITNLVILHTGAVDYRNSRFAMRKFSSNKFNLDFSR